VRKLEQHIAQIKTAQTPAVTALQAIPGVGPIVAQTVVAVISDPERFQTAKQVASYAGLVPSTNQSGARSHQGRITKRGSPELRAMLCEAAHHASRPDHPLNPYFAKLCARRGYRMAVVAVAHRLLRIMWAMMRDKADFDIARIGIEEGPFELTIKRPYRLRKARALAKAGPDRTTNRSKKSPGTGKLTSPRVAV
jgi:transposase